MFFRILAKNKKNFKNTCLSKIQRSQKARKTRESEIERGKKNTCHVKEKGKYCEIAWSITKGRRWSRNRDIWFQAEITALKSNNARVWWIVVWCVAERWLDAILFPLLLLLCSRVNTNRRFQYKTPGRTKSGKEKKETGGDWAEDVLQPRKSSVFSTR